MFIDAHRGEGGTPHVTPQKTLTNLFITIKPGSFEDTQRRYDGDAILPDGKFGIRYPKTSVPDANLTINSVWQWVPYRFHPHHQILLGNWLKIIDITKNFTQFEPDTNLIKPIGFVLAFVFQTSSLRRKLKK
jgi:hypothetical protein